jgi:hypothetical protein
MALCVWVVVWLCDQEVVVFIIRPTGFGILSHPRGASLFTPHISNQS